LVIGESIAKWERAYSVEVVVVRGETIVVGDKLRSVSVLRLVEERATQVRLETVAMDMNAIWPSSVEILDDGKTIIAAQVSGWGSRRYRAHTIFSWTAISSLGKLKGAS
jgi:hypothetical protein